MKFTRINGKLYRVKENKSHAAYISTQGWIAIGVLGAVGVGVVYLLSKNNSTPQNAAVDSDTSYPHDSIMFSSVDSDTSYPHDSIMFEAVDSDTSYAHDSAFGGNEGDTSFSYNSTQ